MSAAHTGGGPSGAAWCSCASSCHALAIAVVARALYNEPYLSVPMRHSTTLDAAARRAAWSTGLGIPRQVLQARGRGRGRRRPAAPGQRSRVHHRALLGLHAAARRLDAREPRSVIRPGACGRHAGTNFQGACRRAVRPGLRRAILSRPPRVGVHRRGLARVGLFRDGPSSEHAPRSAELKLRANLYYAVRRAGLQPRHVSRARARWPSRSRLTSAAR